MDIPKGSTLAYLEAVTEAYLALLESRAKDGICAPAETYLAQFGMLHECWHTEDLVCSHLLLHWPPPPKLFPSLPPLQRGAPFPGDVQFQGGRFMLGAERGTKELVLDCEKWAHQVYVPPFKMAKAPVTNAEFLKFVEAGGYSTPQLWSFAGRRWLRDSKAKCPPKWEMRDGKWFKWRFDRLELLEPFHPVVNVTWYE